MKENIMNTNCNSVKWNSARWISAKRISAKGMSAILAFGALSTPAVVLAHDGHGNTPLHAVMHMLEANGIWIGLTLLAGIGTLVYQALRRNSGKVRTVGKPERHHDSR
jgi:hypothetical protein